MKFSFFRIPVFIRGIAMGAADVVPGVSGGTIALLTGIYEELLSSIKHLHPKRLRTLQKEGLSAFWKEINGSFLLSLFLGIAVSVLSFARIITYSLDHFPILVWSFFFGLVLASAVYVAKQIPRWSVKHIVLLFIGTTIGYGITILSPAQGNTSFLYLFCCGMLAICAMILPGISGSLILLLLGAYLPIFTAVKQFDLLTLLPVALGAILGLALFSRLLTWLFLHYKFLTLALLTGFILGALNKVWPWKKVLETYTDRHGVLQPLVEKNISPSSFEQLTQQSSQIMPAIGFAITGFVIVFIIEKLAK